jgi:hypothetical protein
VKNTKRNLSNDTRVSSSYKQCVLFQKLFLLLLRAIYA